MKLTKDYVIENRIVRAGSVIKTIKESTKIKEAFLKGSHGKVMKIIEKYLNKFVSVEFDYDIPEGYSNNEGEFVGYTGWLADNGYVRINFLLKESDMIYSIDVFEDAGDPKPSQTIVFDEGLNSFNIATLIKDTLTGALKESSYYDKEFNKSLLQERRSYAYDSVVSWIEDYDFARERIDMIQDERLLHVYTEYVRTLDPDKDPVSQTSFVNAVKKYLLNNDMGNKYARGPYRKVKVGIEKTIILPQDNSNFNAMLEIAENAENWREAFEEIEAYTDDIVEDQEIPPYGLVIYGQGGVGKSYEINKKLESMGADEDGNGPRTARFTGAPNTKEMVRQLYENRNKELIVYDDADAVITNKNSANILKAVLDTDKREIPIPAKTGFFKNMENSYPISAAIIIITNIKTGLPDKTLQDRVYTVSVFMTKEDIIAKLKESVDGEKYGATEEQVDTVAEFLLYLVRDKSYDIKDSQLSFRLFQQGVKFIKKFPSTWFKMLTRKLGINVKTAKDVSLG